MGRGRWGLWVWEKWVRWGMQGRWSSRFGEGSRVWVMGEVGLQGGGEWGRWGMGKGGEYGRWGVRGWEVGKVGSRVGGK